jgi:hypothetical protein
VSRRRHLLIDMIEDSAKRNAARYKRNAPHLATQLIGVGQADSAREVTRMIRPHPRARLLGGGR